jgi:hypothetical protein
MNRSENAKQSLGVLPDLKEGYLAYTINLSPYTWLDNETKYDDVDVDKQRDLLVEIINSSLIAFIMVDCEKNTDVKFLYTEARFEHCEDGRVHVHGYITFPVNRCTKYWCSKLMARFWKYIPHDGNVKKHAIVAKTVSSFAKWKDYILKDIHETELSKFTKTYTKYSIEDLLISKK